MDDLLKCFPKELSDSSHKTENIAIILSASCHFNPLRLVLHCLCERFEVLTFWYKGPSVEGQKSLQKLLQYKYLNLCFKDECMLYSFGTT